MSLLLKIKAHLLRFDQKFLMRTTHTVGVYIAT